MREGKNGIGILVQQGTSYPYVLVGWVSREGDEVRIENAKVIRRFGANKFLSDLAANGPATDTQLGTSGDEDVHRLLVHRFIRANAEAWVKDCPKPKGWDE